MHQTSKGLKQWFFAVKAHIGVTLERGLTHSRDTTAANVHDHHGNTNLLHGESVCLGGFWLSWALSKERKSLKGVKADWLIQEIPSK